MKTIAITVIPVAFIGLAFGQTNATEAAAGATPTGAAASSQQLQIQPLFDPHDPSRTSGGSVTFDPGACSAWHTHPIGQTLIVTAGIGRIQR
jgi:quercetin dioxygenase-like cupin family protein